MIRKLSIPTFVSRIGNVFPQEVAQNKNVCIFRTVIRHLNSAGVLVESS